MKRTITLVASTPFLLGACSVVLTHGPPAGHEKMMTPFSCTEDWGAPALDIALGVLGLVYVLAVGGDSDSPGAATPGAIFAGIFGGSAGLGINNVRRCQAALRALTVRQTEAAAARRVLQD